MQFMAEVDTASAAWDVALANLEGTLQEEQMESMQRDAERKRR